MSKLVFIFTLLISLNLYSQEIKLSENKLEYFFDSTFTGYDTILVYNKGIDSLTIDSIYSKNNFGYFLKVLYQDSSFIYAVFNGYDPLNISIKSNDSLKFIFGYPDFCPICKQSVEIASFSDTIVVHSNSLANKYTYIFVEGDGSTDVKDNKTLPTEFILYQNYPNPFNPRTIIEFNIKNSSNVKVIVYDVLGNYITSLLNDYKNPGRYKLAFNGENLSSGIYFYSIIVNGITKTKSMILLK